MKEKTIKGEKIIKKTRLEKLYTWGNSQEKHLKKLQAKFIKKQRKRELKKRCSGVSLTDHISRILHWKNVILEIFYETDDIQGTFLLKKIIERE